jgi:hypothetical protein
MRYQLKFYFHIPIEKFISRLTQIPIEIKICEIFEMVVVPSFCFGLNTFSPFAINRQKWRT